MDRGRGSRPLVPPAILQLGRPPIDARWLESELAELERLVEAGDTLELVGRLAALVREPRRLALDSTPSEALAAERRA